MILPIPNHTPPLAGTGRVAGAGARNASRPVTEGGEPVRTVGHVGDNENVGGELRRREAARGAENQANQTQNDEDSVAEAVRVLKSKTELRAGIAVIKTMDRMIGTLLDVMG